MTGTKLHHLTTAAPDTAAAPHGAFPGNLNAADRELLARLTGQGIAVLREGEACHWVSPQGTELDALETGADRAAIDRLAALLPNGELVAPVSEEQARNLHHSEVLGHTVWNVQHVFACTRDDLKVDILNEALARLAEEQDVLRTRVLSLGDGWVQAVATPQSGQPLPTIAAVEMPDLPTFRRFVGARRAERIEVDRAPLVRGWAARLAGRWYLAFVTHHALADAYTLPLLFDQLMAAYAALADGRNIDLPSVREQYWQYALRDAARTDEAIAQSREAVGGWFAGASGAMRLPYRSDTPETDLHVSDSLAVMFEPDAAGKLAAFHRAHGITHTQVLTAALALLLRELGNPAPVLRMLQGRRDRASLLNTLGEFTGVALTPYKIPADGTVIDLLQATKSRSLDSLRHRLAMHDALSLTRDEQIGRDETWHRFWAADGEVFVDSVDLDGAAAGKADRLGRSLFADSLMTPDESGVGVAGQAVATLFFQFLKADGNLIAVCSWRRALLARGDAETLCDLLQAITAAMIERPEAPIATLLAPLAPVLAGLRERCGPPPGAAPVTAPAETGTGRAPFFVECQLLNRIGNGGRDGGTARPLFLVHGAFGDASVFLPLARKLDRPVYGLQARGLFDLQTPLSGVEEIAAFYSDLIEEIQPEGPVDLGGYSIGGSFAYEMTRRLQAAGREVASLTLIDALYPSEHARIADGLYDQVHFVAMGLIALTRQRAGNETGGALPPRPPRDSGDRAALIDGFTQFCRDAGVEKPTAWLRGYIGRMVDIQTGYGIDAYRPTTLATQPGRARYFRNRDGLFYGTRAAYMNPAARDPLDGVDYASAWHDLLPGLEETPVEVDNHIEMLADRALQDMLAEHFRASTGAHADATDNEAVVAAPAPDAAQTQSEQYLARLIAEVSGIPAGRIGAADSLERLGMDSLMATEVTQRLQAELGEPVSITLFYECTTLRDLAAQLRAEHPRALSRQTGDAAPAAAGTANARASGPAVLRAAHSEDTRDRNIAVVGLSGRYPNAPDLDAYWKVLRDGVDCITEVPKDRWDWRDYYSDDRSKPGAHYSKWGGFLDDVDKFDSLFFAMSPREAEIIDPQERLFLEASWAALEDAGYRRADLRGADGAPAPVSVYAGVMYSEYQFYGVEESQRGHRRALGGSYAGVANRVSYALDLHGPSLSVDTACSSSLTAIHMACRDLREGVSDVAIAGGVNLTLHPNKYLLLSNGQFISGKGRCESFGEGGEGFIPSEGVGAVILKRLSDAERDGDHIYGVIRGSAVNHGGRTSGYTVPNPVAQERLVRAAFDDAGVDPRAVSYIEAHGTGTKIGDPIEIAGLTRAFGRPDGDGPAQRCRIGSAKSNLGHCEAAAGIAGLTKVLLQLRHGRIAPSLHAETLNPYIDFERTPFVVNRELTAWERPEVDGETCARIAGISSFGAGGANAHLVIEEYRPAVDTARGDDAAGPALIVLSARTAERLRVVADRLCNWIDGWGEGDMPPLQDVAYTLQVGREALSERLTTVVHSYAELRELLGAFVAGEDTPAMVRGCVRDDEPSVLPFDNDEELQEAVAKWVARGKLDRLLALWVQGFAFDWAQLHAGKERRRVSLPTYPFARERHWIELSEAEAAPVRAVAAPENSDDRFGILTAVPEWQDKPVAASSAPDGFHAVIACGAGFGTIPVEAASQVHYVASPDPDPAQRVMEIMEQAFGLVREFAEAHGTERALLQFLVPAEDEDGLAGSLSGLARSVRREYPGIVAQVIALDPADGAALEHALAESAAAPDDIDISGAGETRRVLTWHEVADAAAPDAAPWRDGGVYLITGGLGGLGLIFAQEIARRTDDATLVLVGRSPLRAESRDAIRGIEEHGARVLYRRADVSRWEEVETLVGELVGEDRAPTGIIHAAGIIRDNFIVRKNAKQFASVLAPKVLGAAHIDRATRDLELDFFTLFSSAAGALGNAGQADYAAANAWLDGFAERRSAMVARGERYGRTVSLGWPLWRDGGMNVDAATRDVIARTSGMVPMGTENGIEAFMQAIVRGAPRVVVMEGELAKLRRYVLGVADAADRAPAKAPMPVAPDDLGAATLDRLRALFGEVVKLPAERVDPEERLEAYGIDSVMIAQLNQALEDVFGALSKTLFFEFKRLDELAAHLVEAHPGACGAWCGAVAEAEDEPAAPARRAAPERAGVAVRPAADPDEPIAIVGLSGHYPGAPTLDAFWENLAAGRDGITEVPPERWALDGFYEPDIRNAVAEGKSYGKWGGFLEGFDRFDPFFFNISPREARAMDPQERWLLRAAWEVIEDAGYTREVLAERYGGRVGVFAGITSTGFDLYGPELWRSGATAIPRTSFSSVANRISYLLDLNGPSMAIDTMCSSSLTALHEACEQIRRGACEMAIAGAVNLYAHPASYRNLSANRMLSADGRCKSFGKGGDGFVPGEGVGAVLLKPLSRALADGDIIHAVIRASHVNHGGHTNGYTVPNPVAQGELIRATLDRAGIDARAVSYFEAHGTGTELGDPIEINGMTRAFRADTDERGFCAVGSVKSNIGHLEAAAGMAGLTKVVLQMRHRTLVPSLHAEELNPGIDFATSPFRVQQDLAEWPRPAIGGREVPRIACLSSFGAGGANAHVVIEEFEDTRRTETADDGPVPIVVSARTTEQLSLLAGRLADYLDGPAPARLADIAFTLATGREAMEHRAGFVAASRAQAVTTLRTLANGVFDGVEHAEVRAHKDEIATIRADAAAMDDVSAQLRAGVFAKPLAMWVKGLRLDWQDVSWTASGTPRRVTLPTYPFVEERYWFDIEIAAAPEARASGAPEQGDTDPEISAPSAWDGLCHVVTWDRAEPATAKIAAPEGSVIILGGEGSTLADTLATRVRRVHRGATVVRLTHGGDAESLAEAVRDAGPVSRFYAFADGEAGADAPVAELAFLDVLNVVEPVGDGVECFVVTGLGAGGAGLQGLACALAQSDHRFRVRNIVLADPDLDDEDWTARLISRIHTEPRAPRGAPVRLGRTSRSVEAFVPLAWDDAGTMSGIEEGGVYLLLGGGGMVGRAMTRKLISEHAARVVWVGRTPERDTELQQKLSEFDADSRPAYVQADTLDAASIARAVEDIAARHGRIDGAFFMGKVFHLEDTLERHDRAAFEATFDIRNRGIRNFHAALEAAAPGFVCYFSSAQAYSFLPANESVGYAAAVTAADRVVRELAADSDVPVGTINWGYWQSSVADTEVADRLDRHFDFISDGDGYRVLDRFVGALRAGALDQVLCAGAGESAARLMNICDSETIRLSAPSDVMKGLSAFTPDATQSDIVTRKERDDLERWVSRMLFMKLGRTDLDKVLEKYAPLLEEFAEIPDPGLKGDIWPRWHAYVGKLERPELRAAAALAEACLFALPEVLTGEVGATDVVFPQGSTRLVEALYRDNALSDHFNRELARAVATCVSEAGRPVRILEIGAGTGSTTAMVVEHLQPLMDKVAEYRFTDLGAGFLGQARKRFADAVPAMTFTQLDIQEPLAGQGIAPGSYDIVIATNVLHATRNIRETLRNAKAALARGGVLLVNEITEKSLVGTVSFGMLDGWWSHEDAELRIPGSPLLDAFGFAAAMAAEGFCHTRGLTGLDGDLGQEVIAGVSDGMVRQPEPVEAVAAPVQKEPAPQPVGTAAEEIDIETVIRDALVATLEGGADKVARDVAFSDYGVDSILGVGFVEAINDALGIDLNATVLFEYSNIAQLARHIEADHEIAPAAGSASAPAAPAVLPQEAERVATATPAAGDAIAVIGYSGRFPDAGDADAFWDVLMRGTPAFGELPDAFLRPDGYRWGAVLDERDCFDPLFFNISPREAESMNRHQRLVLEEGWRSLEHAGYDPKGLAESRTGIFVGAEPVGSMGESFTGASDAIIASRLSYFLGLRGAALVVNTGCSSSGVALHLACRSLRAGECDVALAGGVSVNLDPDILVSLAETGMLSPSGTCRTFDSHADGTVLSEGVGIAVLKPLAAALADGDTIHGVIAASAINQDGASNGITAPSGAAQEELIADLYDAAGIDPRTISYVEAHGTGTALGDPVEANALRRVFARSTSDTGFCTVGSAKAHIGHTSAASGVIGLIKVLLSLRHRTLPPLPGFEGLNERIEFADSPFRVAAEETPWASGNGPLTAALSSFGHSGTNAHFVVREHPAQAAAVIAAVPEMFDDPVIVPVSARTPERLRDQVRRLGEHLRNMPEASLRDVAFTLRHGREAMEERAVFAVRSVAELADALARFDPDARNEAGLSGDVRRWIAGGDIDWPALPDGPAPRRVPLPTYPFARDVYPVPSLEAPAVNDRLHPLVHANRSGLGGVRYTTRFDGSEFFLAGHTVDGVPVMPGVAYLEMARAAVELAGGGPVRAIEDVVWERPFRVDGEPGELDVELSTRADGAVAFVISSGTSGGERCDHARGIAFSGGADDTSADIRIHPDVLSQPALPGAPDWTDCRRAFEAAGIRHGAAMRAVTSLNLGEHGVVARLSLPDSRRREPDEFGLHPTQMDSALQAAMALTLHATRGTASGEPSMPFALDRLDIFADLPPDLSCRVRRADGTGNGKLERLDIELFDDDGKVLARLSGLTSRAVQPVNVETAPQEAVPQDTPLQDTGVATNPNVTHLLAPVWSAGPAENDAPLDPPAGARVLVAGGTVEQREAIASFYPNARHLEYRPTVAGRDVELNIAEPFDHLVWIAPPSGGALAEMAAAQGEGVMHLFALIRALLRAGRTLDELSWTIVTHGARAVSAGEVPDPTHAAVHGLAGSMAKEYPHWRVRMLDVAPGKPLPVDDIFHAPFDPAGEVLARRDDAWFRQELLPADGPDTVAPVYRSGGTYLVIGGAGGLGEAWSRAVIEAHGAQIVWVGRRPLDADIQRKLDGLVQTGPAPVYIRADAGDPDALTRACADIRTRFGRIDGVVHSALVLEDRSLAAMEPDAFRAALHPKVDASIALAQALADDAPDFVLFFSSLQSFTMAAGQSNYAAGSTFADAFAEALPARLACPVKVMNWGYWGSVGIVADDLHRERMARAGLVSIEPEEGMAALAGLLSGPFARLALVKTRAGVDLSGSAGGTDSRVTVYRAEIPSGIQLLGSS